MLQSLEKSIYNLEESKNSYTSIDITSNSDNSNKIKQLDEFRHLIEECKHLIEIRDEAEKIIKELDINSEGKVVYLNRTMSFIHARKFSFTNLLGISWSINDIITKVSGRLLFSNKKKKSPYDPNNNPKLENFMFDEFIPFSISKLVLNNYGYAINVSYSIRNLFLHGSEILETGKFFEINDDSEPNLQHGKYDISIEGTEYQKRK